MSERTSSERPALARGRAARPSGRRGTRAADGRGSRPTGIGFLALVVAASACASAGCQSTPPPPDRRDSAVARDSAAGRAAFDQGEYALAADLYGLALTRARAIDSAEDVIDAAIAAAVCDTEAQNDAAAERRLREAAYEARRAGSPRAPEIALLRARAAYRQHRPDDAEALAAALAADAAAPPRRRGRAQVLLGEIACDRREAGAARSALFSARALLAPPGDVETADLEGLAGRIAELGNDPASAAAAFNRQADACRRAGTYRRMASSLARAGAAYAAAGRRDLAADRYYRAARSAVARGDAGAAQTWTAAAASNDPSAELRPLLDGGDGAAAPPPAASLSPATAP